MLPPSNHSRSQGERCVQATAEALSSMASTPHSMHLPANGPLACCPSRWRQS
jgi:hypothetical protein